MHQLRSQARDLAKREEDIGSKLESLDNPDRKSLDDSAQRQQLVKQMAQQESALTNLLGQMQNVSEQAETSEPLLSQQLYDALRRASQMHNDNLFQTGEELLDHGLVTQAAGAETAARKNINELRDKVERAAESVLGNESDALHYAQKELDDLAAQIEKKAAAPEQIPPLPAQTQSVAANRRQIKIPPAKVRNVNPPTPRTVKANKDAKLATAKVSRASKLQTARANKDAKLATVKANNSENPPPAKVSTASKLPMGKVNKETKLPMLRVGRDAKPGTVRNVESRATVQIKTAVPKPPPATPAQAETQTAYARPPANSVAPEPQQAEAPAAWELTVRSPATTSSNGPTACAMSSK
jgi:hypothetical protein